MSPTTPTPLTPARILAAAGRLAPMPVSAHRLASIVSSPEFDFRDIVDVIDHDMALSAAVLSAGNAAAVRGRMPVQSVREAVVRIGATRTVSVATMLGLRDMITGRLEGYDLEPEQLWRHSVAASIAAELIRSEAPMSLPSSLGAAALLHDVGKLILHDLQDAERRLPVHCRELTGDALCIAERDVFGIDHPEAGALVAQHWQLPAAIVEGIATHHSGVDSELSFAVHLADLVAHRVADQPSPSRPSLDAIGGVAPGADHDGRTDPTDSELDALGVLGIPSDRFDALLLDTTRQLEDVIGRYALDRDGAST